MRYVWHFKRPEGKALCGQKQWYSLTDDYRDVTCKICLRQLLRLYPSQREVNVKNTERP